MASWQACANTLSDAREEQVAEADFASRHARRLAEIPSQSPPGALAPTHEYN
jgi:hypothetical protein